MKHEMVDYAEKFVQPKVLADALGHIVSVANASRSQTRRIRWIKERAELALGGVNYSVSGGGLEKKIEVTEEKFNKLKRHAKRLEDAIREVKSRPDDALEILRWVEVSDE